MEQKKKKNCLVPPKPPANNSRVRVGVCALARRPVPAEEVFCGGREKLVLVMDDLPCVCAAIHSNVAEVSVPSLKVRCIGIC